MFVVWHIPDHHIPINYEHVFNIVDETTNSFERFQFGGLDLLWLLHMKGADLIALLFGSFLSGL